MLAAGLTFVMPLGEAQAQPSLDNIPVAFAELRMVTCDVDNAQSGDTMYLEVQLRSGLDSNPRYETRKYHLDGPGTDRSRGKQDSYVIEGLPAVALIDSIALIKPGSDGWCMESVQLRVNGQGAVFAWNANNDDGVGSDYMGPLKPRSYGIWLDNNPDGANSTVFRMSDHRVAKQVKVGSSLLSFDVNNLPSGTWIGVRSGSITVGNDPITISFRHDGILEPNIKFTPAAPGETRWVFLGDNIDVLESLWLRNDDTSSDSYLAIDEVTINSQNPWHDTWFHTTDSHAIKYSNGWNTATPTWHVVSKPVHARVGAVSSWKFQSLPMRRESSAFAAAEASLAASPATNRSVCAPPAAFESWELERLIGQYFREVWDSQCNSNDARCTWSDDGYVNVTRKNATTAHARVRFELSIRGPNATVFVDFDITPSCNSTTSSDGDVTNTLTFATSTPVVDTDVSFLTFLTAAAIPKVRTKLLNGLAKLSAIEIEDPESDVQICPVPSVAADGDILFRWPTIPFPNLLCQ